MMKQGAVATLHNEVRKKMRSTKENWIEERCDAIQKGMKAGNSKDPYDTLNDLTKTNHQRSADKDSKLITEKGGVLRRWV